MRYDAAIIGAGADGLAAAATLARAGLRTIVLERGVRTGGRLTTREFHPGFRASPFADEVAPIPAGIFWSLELARHGALIAPAWPPLALWKDRSHGAGVESDRLANQAARGIESVLARASTIEPPATRWKLFGSAPRKPWPAQDWSRRSLASVLAESLPRDDDRALFAASSLAGRAADPFAAGSAVHLLAPNGGSGLPRGGLGALGDALVTSARAAGAEISCGLEVTDIRQTASRITALALADGSEIEARAIVSTLDLKRTFLSLFSWKGLPADLVRLVGAFRLSGSTARILFALDKPPEAGGVTPRGTIHLAPDLGAIALAHIAWRNGVLSERLPISLRIVSATDPDLAPLGAAVMTATVGCVPHTLFDGSWTNEKRAVFVKRVLDAIEDVFPRISTTVLASVLHVPPDIEQELGLTAGDLGGGEFWPDQLFAYRPWHDRDSPRTPIEGLYLAGPSSAAAPHATCVAGVVAARAVLADLQAGRLR